jgi:hypothetical protein
VLQATTRTRISCPRGPVRCNFSALVSIFSSKPATRRLLNQDDELTMTTRRTFLSTVAAVAAAGVGHRAALAQSAQLSETDPQATALGYRHDTTKVDQAKYPKHAAAQKCAGCALFQAKAGDKWGACALFAGKQVNANGWCSAWAKKA